MINLVIAIILALCAVVVRLNPKLINVLSEEDCKRMSAKKDGALCLLGANDNGLGNGCAIYLRHSQ